MGAVEVVAFSTSTDDEVIPTMLQVVVAVLCGGAILCRHDGNGRSRSDDDGDVDTQVNADEKM